MTSFRESIKDDFAQVCDDLEAVTYWSRANGRAVAVCPNAKRSLSHDDREAVASLGFAVSDFVSFQIAAADLGLTYRPMLGDWLIDAAGARYVVASVFDSKMTARLRLKCVSLQEVLGSLVSVLERAAPGAAGGPGTKTVVRYQNVPARIWPVQQAEDAYLGDNLKPRYRCAFFADGRQVELPLPQGCAILGPDGVTYEVGAVHHLDALVGFAIADMVAQAPRRAA